ncbi:MAG: AraC family transcriptional regulator [Polyangiaceae bacterium]
MAVDAGWPSVCVKVLHVVVGTAASYGMAPDAVLRALRVTPDLLADPATRVPHDLAVRAWTEIPEALGAQTFGLRAAALVASSSYDVLDHALQHCTTMRGSIEVLMRYQRLLHDANDLRLEPAERGEMRIVQRLRLPSPAPPPHLSDFISAQWVLRGEKLAGERADIRRVWLTRAAPDDVSEHRRVFGAPIGFSAEINAMWFDAGFLDRPIHRADPSLSPVLRRHADDLLAALAPSNSLATSLHRHLVGTLSDGLPNIGVAASALGVSTRSLQRKLEEEGTSFKGVLDDVRRTLALAHLRDGNRTVSEVAFLVGFSEVSAFSRAFKRWTGKSAVSYRRASA